MHVINENAKNKLLVANLLGMLFSITEMYIKALINNNVNKTNKMFLIIC